jgi:hypothetical protein
MGTDKMNLDTSHGNAHGLCRLDVPDVFAQTIVLGDAAYHGALA